MLTVLTSSDLRKVWPGSVLLVGQRGRCPGRVKIKSKARAMSISILNSISEADAKALLAKLLGEAVPAKPESPKGTRGFAPKNDDWKAGEASYPQKMRILSYLDGSPKVKARQIDPEGVALTGYWENGEPLTFGELFTVEDRDDGKRNFPVLWTGLTAGEASDVRNLLEALPAKPESEQPKAAKASPKAKFKPKQDALIQQLAEGQFAQPAKPVAAAGVTKVPAKPGRAKAAKPPVAKPDAPKVHQPGDSVWVEINGEAVERFLSADSKRLNATK